MLTNLKGKNVILASKSPRRQELLKGLDIEFKIRTMDVEEIYPTDLPKEKVPEYLAELKAAAFDGELEDNDVLITSDTIVILGEQILEKPGSREEAIGMISQLAGNTHTVVTAVCITSNQKKVLFSNLTKVTFTPMSDEEIAYYIDQYQPFDKAGSYGCQEWLGYIGIEKLEGSFYSVMGLPLHQVYQALKQF